MKLISFDIGIKNMAYCVFTVDGSTIGPSTPCHVQDWNIINLMEIENTIVYTCTCTLTTKTKPKSKDKIHTNGISKICGKRATYEKNGAYFCEKHAKTTTLGQIPSKDHSKVALSKKSRDELATLGQMNPGPWHNVDPSTIPKTKKDCLAILLAWYQEHSLVPLVKPKSKTASETDLITIGRNIRDRLDEIDCARDVTHVIMENQISPLAGRMKTVQGMLAQYYIMQPNTPHIEFISSANKLKDLVPKVSDPTLNDREKYKQHKVASVEICNQFLAQNTALEPWIPVLQKNHTKRDDLADCFLQGIWYLQRAKLITYAENLKINSV